MSPKFKNSNGNYLLRSLFFEWSWPDRSNCLYTLKRQDHEGYPSFYRLYFEILDPTEWRFANTYLADWGHWEALCATEWFAPEIEQWRFELDLAVRSQALCRIMAEARTNSKESFQANKYLLEKGWKDKAGKGRPSKQQIREAASEAAERQSRVKGDMQRLNLVSG